MQNRPIPPHHKATMWLLAVFAVGMVLIGLWVGGGSGFAITVAAVIGAIVGALTVRPLNDRLYEKIVARAAHGHGTRRGWLRRNRL